MSDRCFACGRRGCLDAMGGCSSACDAVLMERFAASGHTHGPDDPDPGIVGGPDCPACVSKITVMATCPIHGPFYDLPCPQCAYNARHPENVRRSLRDFQ